MSGFFVSRETTVALINSFLKSFTRNIEIVQRACSRETTAAPINSSQEAPLETSELYWRRVSRETKRENFIIVHIF